MKCEEKAHLISYLYLRKESFIMSNNGDFAATMYESDPIVAALNKVPGFDPLKLMSRRRTPGAEKDERYLDFRYKKLWFRLAHR